MYGALCVKPIIGYLTSKEHFGKTNKNEFVESVNRTRFHDLSMFFFPGRGGVSGLKNYVLLNHQSICVDYL